MALNRIISKLKVPVFQAPMAGGINNPHFVSEVINAGAVGSFGFGYSQASDIDKYLSQVLSETKKGPLNANFFIFNNFVELQNESNAIDALFLHARVDKKLLTAPKPPFYPALSESLEPIWKHCPQILTFHFGLPPEWVLNKAKDKGILVGITATTPTEAQAIIDFGADFIIAQGIEAGGHRGSFQLPKTNETDNNQSTESDALSTIDLVKEIRQINSTVSIVAAGGIMNGHDIHTMLQSGANACQLGTAFLTCKESTATSAHKRYILNHQEYDRDTVMTSVFSGRPARCLNNRFIKWMKNAEEADMLLPFPVQNTLTGALRKDAKERDDGESQSLYTGMHYKLARELSASDLVNKLDSEYRDCLLYIKNIEH